MRCYPLLSSPSNPSCCIRQLTFRGATRRHVGLLLIELMTESHCAGCLVSITAHGPRAVVAQVLGHELLVEDNGQGLQEGLEEEGQNKGEKEIGEERHSKHNAQMTMHVWSDARWTT